LNRRTFARASLQTLAAVAAAAPAFAAPQSPAANSQPSGQPPFPLSVMLWTVFKDLPFEQRLEKIAQAGYRNVELVGEYAKWTPADFDKANAARKRLGITFDATAGMKHSLCDPAQRDAFVAELHNALKPMQSLGCPSMIVLSGNVVPGLSREAQHAGIVDGLKRAASGMEGQSIEGKPVMLLLECIDPEENPRYFLQSAAEALEIVRAVNHPQVRFLYDLYHEQIAEGNLIEKLEKNIDWIRLIHVADVPGRHEPGTGEINYQTIYRKLAELKYKGMVAMEFYPTSNPVETLRRAKQQVRG
jgi:hydroxypyruvate isomerase